VKLLVVDDNPINQKLLYYSLKKEFDIELANNGLEAVNSCDDNNFDVVLMDLMMPIMDGAEATLKIRESNHYRNKHIPIILVIVTGDMVSGEFEAGTIRLVLCSSISRWQWLAAKIIVAFVYILAFMFFCGILMILPSRLYFGSGDLLIFNAGIQVIEEAQIYPKFIIALLFGTLGMCAFASVSIMFSVLYHFIFEFTAMNQYNYTRQFE